MTDLVETAQKANSHARVLGISVLVTFELPQLQSFTHNKEGYSLYKYPMYLRD